MKPPHNHRHGGPRRGESSQRDTPRTDRPAFGAQQGHPHAPHHGKPGSSEPGRHGGGAHHGERGRGQGPWRSPDRHPSGPRPQAATRGGLWLYGLHAVAAALGNPTRRLRRLVVTEEAETSLANRVPHPWPVPHERMERARLDQMLGRDAVHQGVALLADPLAPPPLAQVLERSGPLIVLDQVTDPRNVGAILRSAAAFGAAGVIVQDRNAPEETGALAKAASGALETVPLLRAVNIARTMIALKAANCWVVGLDAGGGKLSGPALAARRVALVLGAEGEGLRRLTRETCDEIAGLAMTGAMESLNVAAAASVALYELGRRET